MEWLAATVGAALIWSVLGIIAKDLMDHSSSFIYSFLYSSLGLLFYTPIFLYYLPGANLNFSITVLVAFVISGIANIFGIMAYNYSIKFGELSRVIPFTKLNPIFTAIIAAATLGEKITPVKGSGILLVTIGSYVILEEKDTDWEEPFRKFIRLKAPKVAALSALIFSVAAVADRFATQVIQPEIYTYMIYLFMTAGLSIHLMTSRKELIPEIKTHLLEDKLLYTVTGIGASAASYLIFYSFSRAPASSVIPVLQIQVLVSVVAGTSLFGEDNLKQKLIGSAVLIAGVVLTVI